MFMSVIMSNSLLISPIDNVDASGHSPSTKI